MDLVKVVEMVAGAVAAETVAAVAAWAGMPDTSHTPTFDRKWTHRTSLSTMPSTGRSRASARRVARWTSRPFPATMRTTARDGHFGWVVGIGTVDCMVRVEVFELAPFHNLGHRFLSLGFVWGIPPPHPDLCVGRPQSEPPTTFVSQREMRRSRARVSGPPPRPSASTQHRHTLQ